MELSKKLIAVAITGAILGLATGAASAGSKAEGKCYGVAKAGQNDCATSTSSCAGSAKQDRQGDAFIVIPKKLCTRLSGSSFDKPKQ